MISADALDRADPLASFRSAFSLPPNRIYLDGNSLGPCCLPAERALLRRLAEWKTDGVEAWRSWIDLPEQIAARLAPIVGADPESVAVCGSTTTNLHQLLATLYRPTPSRHRIVIDGSAFPSDAYAVQCHVRLHGRTLDDSLRIVTPNDNGLLDIDALLAAIDETVAIVLLPAVVFTTGQLLPIAALARAAHAKGALIGIDCAHSIGAVPHTLDADGVDFAFWCSYKYLNAGPGAVGGLYLNRRHFGTSPGLAGWFGNRRETMFAMAHEFDPANGAGALQIGTPHILSLAPLEGSLELFEQAGIDRLRQKSLSMTDRLIALTDEKLARFGVRIVTPREHSQRGGHVTLAHPRGRELSIALRARGIVPDFRPPDRVRLAPAPLYNRFAEIDAAVDAIEQIFLEGGPADCPTETVT